MLSPICKLNTYITIYFTGTRGTHSAERYLTDNTGLTLLSVMKYFSVWVKTINLFLPMTLSDM